MRTKAAPSAPDHLAMGHDDVVDRPGEDARQAGARFVAAEQEGQAPFARRARMRLDDAVEPGDEPLPAGEPAGPEILDEVGEDRRAAGAMKEHHLGQPQAASQHHLVDIGRPGGIRPVAEIGVEGEVLALLAQPRRGIEAGLRIGRLPFAEEEVVQLVGRHQEAHGAERLDRALQLRRERDRRPHEQAAVCEAHDHHARRIGEAVEIDDGPIAHPDIRTERLERRRRHCVRHQPAVPSPIGGWKT